MVEQRENLRISLRIDLVVLSSVHHIILVTTSASDSECGHLQIVTLE